MLTFTEFSGINNVLPPERLKQSELTVGTNVDIDNSGALIRRQGYSSVDTTCHKNLWQASGFMLATCNGDLIARSAAGVYTTLYPSLGVERVWFCNLPDGRTTFSNGLINGITDGLTITTWGVPLPASLGNPTSIPGDLFPGSYQWQISHVRLSDGQESGQLYSNPTPLPDGGIMLTGLPVLAGHKTNVYLTGESGGTAFLAGSTTGSTFTFAGTNTELALPSRTDGLYPAPKGTVTAMWRGRILVAEGGVLWASRSGYWELFDIGRDFKQFSAPITLIQPTDDGVYVGTEKELAFLAGTEFDRLVYSKAMDGRTVLGSGVEVQGELVRLHRSVGAGRAMICITDRTLVAGFAGGVIQRLSEGRYATDVLEVAATFRKLDGIPQYVAVPQA